VQAGLAAWKEPFLARHSGLHQAWRQLGWSRATSIIGRLIRRQMLAKGFRSEDRPLFKGCHDAYREES
jgi:hypothetical protein